MISFYSVNNKGYAVSFGKTFSKNKVEDVSIKIVLSGALLLYADVSKELSDYLKKNKSAWSDFALFLLEKADIAYYNNKKDLLQLIWE